MMCIIHAQNKQVYVSIFMSRAFYIDLRDYFPVLQTLFRYVGCLIGYSEVLHTSVQSV
jgi:hypothetical protein